ncbi:MAG: phosphoenolpyruvate synthase, partial [Gemmatimonadota bacterium]|uniref:phosphoenolpyruvate synthase n=1 Tax=Candidatus Palauibacter scopulicola TaxID=3056741 RepID=UPI0023983AAD
MSGYIAPFESIGLADLETVGGKNASLGEMISHLAAAGVDVPGGFAITARAYRDFLSGELGERIHAVLDALDVEDLGALARAGREIRGWIADTPLPPELAARIGTAYRELGAGGDVSVAVRSSATAEDLPEASFAGQQDTLLNVRGVDAVLRAVHHVYGSLFSDRAIAYRVHQGFAHRDVALSVGVQRMARADRGSSGVMFTLDTESGFRDVVFITSAYGLGETVVQGGVNPDEFYVYKPALRAGRHAILRRNLGGKAIKLVYADSGDAPVETVEVPEADRLRFSLTDDEVHELARQALLIEDHYGRPMDIEWARDGIDGALRILQARPETVQSRAGGVISRFTLKERGPVLAEGRSIGGRIGGGPARVIESASEIARFRRGDVLVTDMTDPDWEPMMKQSAAIVTNRGGRTCHAAIIARELGIPAVVGCGDATAQLAEAGDVTVSCAEGDAGYVYEGLLDFEEGEIRLGAMPEIPLKIMLNVGNPDRAFDFASIPNSGVGLARLEFIINRMIGVHPQALLDFEDLPDELQREIRFQHAGYADPVEFYVEKLTEGIATIAAAFAPEPVIVRLSDFKSNEYADLI